MKPQLSYTIWFSQRTGSTLLCKTLEATGIAGRPAEWLNTPDLFQHYGKSTPRELQEHLWSIASTATGVFSLKHSFHEPHFSRLLQVFQQFPTCRPQETNRAAIWELAFPHHRHIFMTRRNKVRLAVSWWRAIQSQEWHRTSGAPATSVELSDAYSFEAIRHLYAEASMREAGIQEFFTEGNIIPFTITYEDFIQDYEQTIRRLLEFLELDHTPLQIAPPCFSPTADAITEEWSQRFRQELQDGWTHRGW